MKFYVGLHQPSDAKRIDRSFISVNRLATRRKPLGAREWILDSGAFTTLALHGRYLAPAGDYADLVRRFASPSLIAAVSQDYMCEPFMLAKTGLSKAEHQRLTIERYDHLCACDLGGVYLMPVLQGYEPEDYAAHVRQYGSRLKRGAYVGVGSVCKRNRAWTSVMDVLVAIKAERPDLRLHGFGLKTTSLIEPNVSNLLHSADSMAWSFAARREGRNRNDWREAKAFAEKIEAAVDRSGDLRLVARARRRPRLHRAGRLADVAVGAERDRPRPILGAATMVVGERLS
jgi:hypothetical protein